MKSLNIKITQETISYQTLNHINKNIKFLGLSSLQLMLCFVIVVFAFLIKILLGIVVLVLFFFVVKQLNLEQKKGNENYIQSIIIFNKSPKQVEDKEDILKFLIK